MHLNLHVFIGLFFVCIAFFFLDFLFQIYAVKWYLIRLISILIFVGRLIKKFSTE